MSVFGILDRQVRKMAYRLVQRDSNLTRLYLSTVGQVSPSLRGTRLATVMNFGAAANSRIETLLPEVAGNTYPPVCLDSDDPAFPRKVAFGRIDATTFENVIVDPESSFPLGDEGKELYVDPYFHQSRPDSSQACGHLLAHGARKAIVKLRKVSSVIEEGLFLGGNGSYNYYHWLLDIAAKLSLLPGLSEETERLPLLVSKRVAEVPGFAESLQVLAPGRKTIYLDPGSSYLVRKVTFLDPLVSAPFNLRGTSRFAAEDFHTRPQAIQYLREEMLAMISQSDVKRWPERVYLARESQRSYNQDELTTIASSYGFEVILPEKHSLREQVEIFAGAEAIVGPTGAAWTNLVFANSGCKALCWMAEELAEFASFSNIAVTVGIDLRYLLYPSGIRTSSEHYRHVYRICPNRFRQALDSMGFKGTQS